MNFLSINNVSKIFEGNDIAALSNIYFEIKKGGIFALVGESGCGKTTLLKVIGGLEDATGGAVFYKNEKILGPSQKLVPGHKEIKMVFQDSALFPNFSVQENILYQLKHYNNQFKLDRLEQVLVSCKLSEYRHRLPRQLSGGQKQRAAMATALADNPPLLLLDEPFSNLDSIYKFEIRDLILDLVKISDTTVIFVTHDILDAFYLASEIGLMANGQMLQIGTAEELYRKPTTLQAARLTGYINVIPSTDLNIPNNSMDLDFLCLRPEDIKICSEESKILEGTVLYQRFMGAYNLIQIKISAKLNLLIVDKEYTVKPGSRVFLNFNPEDIIEF